MYTLMVIRDRDLSHASHQVLYWLKVFYTGAFDYLVVQQPPKGVKRFTSHASMASTETKLSTGKLVWGILRVSREFQSRIA
jgi:hypothetical protein